MPKTIAVILFLALSLQVVAKLGILALYQVNKEYISKNLCENRAKPKMHCNGKCYLKKQLKKAEENEKSDNPTSKSEILQFVAFIIPAKWQQELIIDENVILHHNSFYNSISGINPLKDIFHPPQADC